MQAAPRCGCGAAAAELFNFLPNSSSLHFQQRHDKKLVLFMSNLYSKASVKQDHDHFNMTKPHNSEEPHSILMNLPAELLIHILAYLGPASIHNVRQVCFSLRDLTRPVDIKKTFVERLIFEQWLIAPFKPGQYIGIGLNRSWLHLCDTCEQFERFSPIIERRHGRRGHPEGIWFPLEPRCIACCGYANTWDPRWGKTGLLWEASSATSARIVRRQLILPNFADGSSRQGDRILVVEKGETRLFDRPTFRRMKRAGLDPDVYNSAILRRIGTYSEDRLWLYDFRNVFDDNSNWTGGKEGRYHRRLPPRQPARTSVPDGPKRDTHPVTTGHEGKMTGMNSINVGKDAAHVTTARSSKKYRVVGIFARLKGVFSKGKAPKAYPTP